MLPVDIQAIRLDPQDVNAWLTLAKTAAFAGDGALADSALRKAIRLDPSWEANYMWGLELYQPKWYGGDPEKLSDIVREAAAASKGWPFGSRLEGALTVNQIADYAERPGLLRRAGP